VILETINATQTVSQAAPTAFLAGFGHAMLLGAALTFLAAATAFLLLAPPNGQDAADRIPDEGPTRKRRESNNDTDGSHRAARLRPARGPSLTSQGWPESPAVGLSPR
jgi:hypothetical protein